MLQLSELVLIEFFKAYVLAYATYYGGTIFHEVGHAPVGKIVEPESNVQIHLNTFNSHLFDPNDLGNELFRLGPFHYHLESFTEHSTIFTPIREDQILFKTKAKNLPFTISGGIFQLIYTYSVFAYKAFSLKYKETQNFKESLFWGIKNAFFPYKNLLEKKNLERKELIYESVFYTIFLLFSLETLIPSLLPSTSNVTDGTIFWQALTGKEIPQFIKYICEYSIWPISLLLIYKALKTGREGTRKIAAQEIKTNSIEIEDEQSEEVQLAI
jgi:hypothetical protein